MFSREEHYYEGQAVGDNYLDTPGMLQFNRLFNQQPGIFLQDHAALRVLHKRSIVINDWSDELLNQESLLYQYFALLLDEGFPLYQIQGKAVVPIPHLRALSIEPSHVVNEREVYKLLNSHGLEKKKVYLLNHDKILKLCGEFTLSFDFQFKFFPQHLNLSNENNECRAQYNLSRLVLTQLEQVETIADERIRRLSLSTFWDKSVLNAFNPDNLTALRLEHVPPEGISALVHAAVKVNSLYVRPYVQSVCLDMFSPLHKLETLILNESNQVLLNLALPSLKRLILVNQTKTAIELEAMLKNMPNLESLELQNVTILSEFHELSPLPLKVLNINSCIMSNSVISSLVNQSASLVSLALQLNTNDYLEFEPKKFLRLLILSDLSIKAQSLSALCSKSLVHLGLGPIKTDGEITFPHSLNHLVRLTAYKFIGESEKTWEHLSKCAPNISDLTLNGNWDYSIAPNFPKLHFFLMLGSLITSKDRAISELERVHRLKLEASISIITEDEYVRYIQDYSTKVPVSKLVIPKLPNDLTSPIIQACPWIKTIIVGNVSQNYSHILDNSHTKKWVIANSIELKSRDFKAWKTMEIDWQLNMKIKIDDFECEYGVFNKGCLPLLVVTGKIEAEDLRLLFGKFPNNRDYDIIFVNLEIVGQLQALPFLNVKVLYLKKLKFQASTMDTLIRNIGHNHIQILDSELLSPVTKKYAISLRKAHIDQSSWNNGLSDLLKIEHLVLTLNGGNSINANEGVTALNCNTISPNQQTLSAINGAFVNLKSLGIEQVVFDNFKSPTTTSFKVENLVISQGLIRSSGMQGFFQQFPKLKTLILTGFHRNLLFDFKKYCPDLELVQLLGSSTALKEKDLIYLNNALPSPCKILLVDCTISEKLEPLITKYPRIEFTNYKLAPTEDKKGLVSDFKPYNPTPTALDPNWSQGMLINKLIRYLELMNLSHTFNTSVLKKGICSGVAKWFADTVEQKGLDAWKEKWQLIKSWDKNTLPLPHLPLRMALEELKDYVSRYQLNVVQPIQIITNNLSQFLDVLPQKPLFVCNAWHRTCLLYKEEQWLYFDPNYKYGEPQCFDTKEEVVKEILRVLGPGLAILSYDELLKSCWSQNKEASNAFLEAGGFGFIITHLESMKALQKKTLSKNALEGLFFLNLQNIPFWYLGLTQGRAGNPLQCQTLTLLAKYAKLTCDQELFCALNTGMSYLTAQQRQPLTTTLSKNKKLKQCSELISNCAQRAPLPIPLKEEGWLPEKLELEPLQELDTDSDLNAISTPIISPVSVQALHEPTTIALNHPFLLSLACTNYQKNPIKPLGSSVFETWVSANLENFESLKAFDLFLSKHHAQNILLHSYNNSQAINYLHHLQASQLMQARGLFVVNTFDDLRCTMSSIIIDDLGKGRIKPPNSGPLYDFLRQNETLSPIIAINWSNFTTSQLIQANSVLDKHRNVDRVNVPDDTLVLGLQNPQGPNAYLGSDFSSRHAKLCEFPNHLNIPEVELPTLEEGIDALECVIELYGETNWEAYLFGHWKLTEQGFFFEKSTLLKVLEKKPNALKLVVRNAPSDNPSFSFAFKSLVSKGFCMVNGQRFELPKQSGIRFETGYHFKALFENTVISMQRGYLSQDDLVINRDASVTFFENYQIFPDTKTLITLPGLLENYATKPLSLCVTSSLSLGAYARLLEMARLHHLKVSLKIAPGVSIPEELTPFMTENVPVKVMEPTTAQLIVSNDLHGTEKILQEQCPFDMVIDISEESKDKLLYAISGRLDGETPLFNETISDVWNALTNNKRVLLKGEFSQALIDVFALFFKSKGGLYHNGQWEIPTGELVLLANSDKGFSFVSQLDKRDINFGHKMALLGPENEARLLEKYSEQELSEFSYAYLLELALTKILPDKPGDLIKPLLQLPDLPAIDEDYTLEEAQSKAFKERRKAQLLGALAHRPTAFLSGETAVGKSSFMHELEQEPDILVIFNDLEAWLNAPVTKQLIILFIDEANLVNTDWLRFEGLYSTPPSIFYKGKHYPLDDRFKVVFAGNPANYSQERRLPKLFQNHPNTVVFGAMNNAYLHHEVLKPILGDNKEIARIFLKTFQWVKNNYKEVISARELQMMAYFFQAQHNPEDATEKAKVIAANMVFQVVAPNARTSFFAWFVKEFGELKPEFEKMPKAIGRFSSKSNKIRQKKMLLTPSHYKVYRGLNAFMDVRRLKQQWRGKASFGGLSEFLLEGEPGIGKSYFVKEFLINYGLYEENIEELSKTPFDYEAFKKTNPQPTQGFYHIPSSLKLSVKIDLLNRAFHQGAVVVIDEINTAHVLEELMNALLMGEDLKGRRALVPGFTVIGTQNPSFMEGRELASKASARRTLHYEFPTYTPEEMVDVLMYKGLNLERACALVYDYLCRLTYARKNNLHPEPCFRNVLREAKRSLKKESLNTTSCLVQLPYAQTALISLLNLDNPNHRALLLQIQGWGYEKFFYVGEDKTIYFLPEKQGHLKQTLLDNKNVSQLESHLRESIKSLPFIGVKRVGNEALEEVLMNHPLETLSVFLKTASFEKIDYQQLELAINKMDKTRFYELSKVFKAFCKQVDENTSSNQDYKEKIEKRFTHANFLSKNRFFSKNVEEVHEKTVDLGRDNGLSVG